MNSSFDGQANDFDQRTGLPVAACHSIVDAIFQVLAPVTEAGVQVVELGAGTGQIGQHFRRKFIDYIGLDNSLEMLEIFKTRIANQSGSTGESFELVHTDVNDPWPVCSKSTDLVFSSRAVHLFETQHVCEELNRIATSKGLVFAAGRRQREKNSVQSIMRRQMRHFLREQGVKGRDGQNHIMKLTEHLEQFTTVNQLDSKTVSNWTSLRSPIDSIQAWRKKDGLAGLQIDNKTKETVLSKLESWAAEQFDDISAKSLVNEFYVLDLLRIRPKT